jgi:tripartite-type tricarboxylate transporter receptor subunit TctC
MIRRSLLIALAVALAAVPFGAGAQSDYPSRPIEFVIVFPPGGPLDTAVRLVQPQLSANLGVPLALVNKGGAGGAIGMEYVARAKPDGYTVAASVKSTLTVVPASRKDLPYKLTDFAIVGSYAVDSQGVLSKPNAPWKSLDEMVAYAKKNPGKLTYGSAGAGTISHLNMEMLKQAYGLDIAHVPFGGTGPVKNAILGGHVDLATTALSPMLPLVRSGDLVALVTTAPRRLPGVDAPTMAEKGLAQASLNTTSQLYVPARTPREVVERLGRALEKTMKDPAVIAAIERAGMVADYQDGDATRKDIEAEHRAIAGLVQKLGLAK